MFDVPDIQRLIEFRQEAEDFVECLIKCEVIKFGDFIGKSRQKYAVETDIRKAYVKQSSAIDTTERLLNVLDKNAMGSLPFIGVPETGTLIANYLNQVLYFSAKKDFFPNALRAAPKYYQKATDSVYTVLPANREQEYSLIEDDVVTGDTVVKYLEVAIDAGLKIKNVITVFYRKSADSLVKFCENNGINHFEIITVK